MNEKNNNRISENFVICDIQEKYAEHLLKLLTEEFSGKYQFFLFREIQKAERFIKESGAGIILVSEEYRERIQSYENIGKQIIITEHPVYDMRSESTEIFRYQSAGEILKNIKNICKEPEKGSRSYQKNFQNSRCAVKERRNGEVRIRDKPEEKDEKRGELIGIYSPIHRIGKTRFAMRLGKKMSKDMSVLYLNMEGYSGGNYYFQNMKGNNLGDLLYTVRQERGDYGLKISAMTGQMGGMDYVLPMENEQDLKAVTCEEWFELFDMINEKCIYEAVILDLGESIDGIYDILRRCSRIYTPYISEGAAVSKMKQYEKNLRESGYGDVLDRTIKKLMKRTGDPEGKTHSIVQNERNDVIK